MSSTSKRSRSTSPSSSLIGVPSTCKTPTAKRSKTFTFTDTAPSPPYFDFADLITRDVELGRYAVTESTLDFKKRPRETTLCLTRAILHHHYGLEFRLAKHQLIPTVPNRQQYLEWAVSLVSNVKSATTKHTLLDIGTGPSCIYGLLCARLYPAFHIVATDTDRSAVESARKNVQLNHLTNKISVIHDSMFPIDQHHQPTLTICNPPFHSSIDDHEDHACSDAGTKEQLVTKGGEVEFISSIARQSVHQYSVHWFSSLIGCKSSLSPLVSYLRSCAINATHVRTVELHTGGRTVRWAIAWTFGTNSLSKATCQLHASQKWRITIVVTPGRKFANQLSTDDMAEVCMIALMEHQWDTDENVEHNNNQGIVFMTANQQSNVEGTRISLHTTGPAQGTFSILVKMQRRASMTETAFHNLCEQLTDGIPKLLDNT